MTSSPLLPLRPSFLGRLSAVRGMAYPLFRGIYPIAAHAGPPTDFDGHRPYLPGDDTRWIDWNLFARLEELFVKVFRVEEEVEVVMMVDVSPSMTLGEGTKYQMAAATATALLYLGFLTAHPVTLIRYAERSLDKEGPYRHIQAFPSLSGLLLTTPEGQGTDLRKSLTPILANYRRPVTVIVATDGFQREPLEQITATLTSFNHHRILFFWIVDPQDYHPPLRGNLLLQDAEVPDSCHVIVDQSLERQLHRRIATHIHNLQNRLRGLGAEIFHLQVNAPFEKSFLDLLSLTCPPGRPTSSL